MKIFQSFARSLKSKVPLSSELLNIQFNQQKQAILEAAVKQVNHAHTIKELKELYTDVTFYVDISSNVLQRLKKINLDQEEIVEEREFIQSMLVKSPLECLYMMDKFEDENIERTLLDLYKQKQFTLDENTQVKMFEIISKYGQYEDLDFELTIKGARNIARIYNCLLSPPVVSIQEFEKHVSKYIHLYDYNTIVNILLKRSFNSQALNEDLVYTIIQRLLILDLDLKQIIKINHLIMVELKYSNNQWLGFIQNKVYQIIETVQAKESNEQQESKDEDSVLNLEAKEQFINDKDLDLLQLMEQLCSLFILKENHFQVIQLFSSLEVHFMPIFNQLTADQQITCFKFHSRLAETYYNESKKDDKTYKPSTRKRIEAMNNTYFETTIDHTKQLSFHQTLLLLNAASVLGVSKRKVCQKIMNKGLEGLKHFELSKFPQPEYALLSYYKLIKLFITKPTDLLQIESTFKTLQIDTLQLQIDHGHESVKPVQLI